MHNRIEMLMSMALDGEATPAEEAQVRAHLATCAPCAELWQRWSAVDVCLTRAPTVTPPPDFLAGVAARLGERQQRRAWSRWFGAGVLLTSALILVGFWLAITGVFWWGYRHPLEVGIALSSCAQFLSSLAWTFRGVETLFGSVDSMILTLGAGASLGLTLALVLLWLRVMSRVRGWVRVPAPMLGSVS